MHEGRALDEAMESVDKLAAQMAGGNATLRDELISAGYAAVARCWKRYDPARGAKFTTFAHRAIKGALKAALRREINQPAQMLETQEAGDVMYMSEFAATGNPPLECRISFRVTAEAFERLATLSDKVSDAGQALSVNETARALMMLALRED